MKITDVTVTMWEWKDIPASRYTKTVTSTKSRSTQMGLLKILTDEGIEGHAFLGSSFQTAVADGPFVIKTVKPTLIGEDPFNREKIWQMNMQRYGNRIFSFRQSILRFGISPAKRQICQSTNYWVLIEIKYLPMRALLCLNRPHTMLRKR